METIKVCLHKKNAHTLERNTEGQWILDGKIITQEKAIAELTEAVKDLGYWCQVAKDVLPTEQFEMVEGSYAYHDEMENNMKIFKMNDQDWVAAETEEQAKDFYKKECGFDDLEIEEGFIGEVPLNNRMFVSVDDIPKEEQKMVQEMKIIGNDFFVLKTFEWVIGKEGITKPCIICSTEY